MAATFKWDKREFRHTLRELAEVRHQTIPAVINQTMLDIQGRAFDLLPPIDAGGNDIQSKRGEIKAEMDRQIATRVKLAKRGKRAGSFIRAVGRARELYAKNLIANYWRGKLGKAGLYGSAMKAYAGAMSRRRQIGVGSLKSVFIPIIRALNPVCKFKFPFNKTSRIARWAGSKGSGIATRASKGVERSTFEITYNERSSQSGKVLGLYTAALTQAFSEKEAKMQREIEREIEPACKAASAK